MDGRPASTIVGTAGSGGTRLSDITAIAVSEPARIWGIAALRSTNV